MSRDEENYVDSDFDDVDENKRSVRKSKKYVYPLQTIQEGGSSILSESS